MDHVRILDEERRDLGAVLPGRELRKLLGRDLDAGLERLHRGLEVGPGILAPGVILIDAGNDFHIGFAREQITRGCDVIHGGVRAGAEQVFVARVLENARRSAIEENRDLLQLIGKRRNRQAIARRNVADHGVDVLPLYEIAVFGHLLGRAARFVDDDGLDVQAVDALGRVGGRQCAGVECFDVSSAALRAGTPNGPAAPPDRNVTMPSLSVPACWAAAGVAANAAAAMAQPRPSFRRMADVINISLVAWLISWAEFARELSIAWNYRVRRLR